MKLLKLVPLLVALSWFSGCSSKMGNVMDSDDNAESETPDDVVVEDRDVSDAVDVIDERESFVEIDTSGAEARVIVDNRKRYQSYELAEIDKLSDPASPLANRVVYFDYDSSVVKEADRATLEAHAAYLADNPTTTVRLIGHTDERGSREYNLALGERRALAVRQLLMLQGASMGQFQVISLGEERPQVEGHYESAWQKNRRVELLYLGQ